MLVLAVRMDSAKSISFVKVCITNALCSCTIIVLCQFRITAQTTFISSMSAKACRVIRQHQYLHKLFDDEISRLFEVGITTS